MPRTNAGKKTTSEKHAQVARNTGERPGSRSGQTTPRDIEDRAQELSDLWELLSAKLDGKDVARTQLKGARLHFTRRGHFIVTVGDRVIWRGEGRFRPDEGPQAIDIIHQDGEFEGAVFRPSAKWTVILTVSVPHRPVAMPQGVSNPAVVLATCFRSGGVNRASKERPAPSVIGGVAIRSRPNCRIHTLPRQTGKHMILLVATVQDFIRGSDGTPRWQPVPVLGIRPLLPRPDLGQGGETRG